MEQISVDGLKAIVMSLEASRLLRVASKHSSLKEAIPWRRPKPETMESVNAKGFVWLAVQKLVYKDPDVGASLRREWEEQFLNLLGAIPVDGDVTTLFKLLRDQSPDVGEVLVALGRISPAVWTDVKALLQVAHSPEAKMVPGPDAEEQRKLETKLVRSHKKELERLKSEKQKAEQEANAKVRMLQNRISSLDEKLRVELTKGRAQDEEITRLRGALVAEKQRVQNLEREVEQKEIQLQGVVDRAEATKQALDEANARTAEAVRQLQEFEARIAILQGRLEAEAVRLPALVAHWARSYDWSSMQYVLEKTQRELQAAIQESQPSGVALEATWSTWMAAEAAAMRTISGLTGSPTPSQMREHLALLWELESSLLVRLAVVRQLAHLGHKVEEYYIKAGGV